LSRARTRSRSIVLAVVAAAFTVIPATALASGHRLGSRTLGAGMRGADVRALQVDLSRVGLRTAATGRFGVQTTRSVRGFQVRFSLPASGVATPQVVRELSLVLTARSKTAVADLSWAGGGSGGSGIPGSTSSSTTKHKRGSQRTHAGSSDSNGVTTPVNRDGGSQHLGERTLRPGMRGHDVRVLQGYLTLAGYPTGIDGSYGAATRANVLKFELAHSLKVSPVFTYADSLVLRQAVVLAVAGGAVANATINPDGTATAPSGAPTLVQNVIASANRIIGKPYIYAGGHSRWNDQGYDCSGSVSYALHGAGLLSSPEDSTGLESFGSPGPGRWITIYADAAHTWVVVAGIAFDTADFGGPNIPSGTGPRWRSNPTANLADGGSYVVRHPAGL
jgi:peptidoglycan hydrolase-like protein with peptidoglycan-binding domain